MRFKCTFNAKKDTILKEEIRPTEVTLTSIVGACAAAGKFDDMLNVMKLFKKQGIFPNNVTYHVVLFSLFSYLV